MKQHKIMRQARDLYPDEVWELNQAEVVALCLSLLEPEEHWHGDYLNQRRYPLGDLPGRTSPLSRHLVGLAIALWLEQNGWHDDEDLSEDEVEYMMEAYRIDMGVEE